MSVGVDEDAACPPLGELARERARELAGLDLPAVVTHEDDEADVWVVVRPLKKPGCDEPEPLGTD